MIKNVVFDLGGVLINYDPLRYIRSLGFDEEQAEKLSRILTSDPFWGEMDLGLYESLDDCIRTLIGDAPAEYEGDLRRFFDSRWMAGVYTPLEQNLPLYRKVRAQGYGIYILSNYFPEGFAFLERTYDFIRDADGRIVSSEVHLKKPQPEIYQDLFDRYGLIPEECIFFDDRKENTDAAKRMGMHAVCFHDVRQAEEAFRALTGDGRMA